MQMYYVIIRMYIFNPVTKLRYCMSETLAKVLNLYLSSKFGSEKQ